jgi:uncharacterized protein YktA (UPF0223 family)
MKIYLASLDISPADRRGKLKAQLLRHYSRFQVEVSNKNDQKRLSLKFNSSWMLSPADW